MLIKNGMLIDGSGKKGFLGDLLIEDNIIKAMGNLKNNYSGKVIDATGKTVTAGFFDAHRHCDFALTEEEFGAIELSQGITSTVTGSCGLTPFPTPSDKRFKSELNNLLTPCLGKFKNEELYKTYKDFSDYLKANNTAINIGNLIGSCTVRIAVKGFDSSNFTKHELELAKEHVKEAMEHGAIGLSMGIMYYPEYYSTKDELSEIAKVVASYDGILTCHIRGEGDGLLQSLNEIIEIAENANIKLQISHLKSCGVDNWSKDIYTAMELIETKRKSGVDVMVDFYPYNGGSTTLMSLIPPSYIKDTLDKTWDYMSTKEGALDLKDKLAVKYDKWDNYVLSLGYDKIIISSCMLEQNKCYLGKTIAQISEQFNIDPAEFICKVMHSESGNVGIIVMSMSASDVDAVAKFKHSYLISDALYSDSKNPHPRLYGAFPKMIRDFVLDRKVLTLEEAILKMTYMPATRMGVNKRGLLKEGYFADINIFEPNNFKDNATFEVSKQLATGMDYVILNGAIAWQDEKIVNNKLGKFLTKK